MDLDWRLALPLLGVLLLATLVTGPGLWSDSWGHWWVHGREDEKPRGRR